VAEQTGIFAGKGGFDVTAGEHTQLNGAVISSTASADKNRLDTGTLGFSNIENHADYKTEHQSVGMSTGGSIGSQFEGNMANGLLAGLNGSGSASSVTTSAVSDGTIIIRDKAKQTQDVSALSRDAEGANPGLDKIFDKDTEQRRMETAQLLAEIGSQAGDIARTQGEIAATKAATEKMKNISPEQKKDAEAQWRKANPGLEPTTADITGQVYQTLYNRAMLDSGMGTGGAVQQGISAATAAIQGLAGGSVAQALSGAAAPYLAEQIHTLTTTKGPDGKDVVNVQANLIAHAVVGAVTAYASGNAALAGASGAAMGEYIAQQMYPGVKREDLSEEQRQTISALGTLAAGLAGGIAGDSAGSAVAGALAGRNAVENNALSGLEGFGSGFWNNVQAQGSLVNNTNLTDENGKVLNPITPEEIKYASDKLITGQLPAGQNAATGLLTAWGAGATTIVAPVLLPATATAGSVIGAGAIGGAANVFNQLNSGEPFSATDALIATGISGVTQGKGFWFTEAASIAGAYMGASLQGKDAAAPMIGAGLGTLGGATIGKGVDKLQTIIPQFTIPKITGAVAESAGSEYLGSSAQNLAEKVQQKLEEKSDAK